MQKLYKELKKLMESSQKNVLCLHRSPDGDSVGSNIAFARVLRAMGKQVDIYCIDPVPEYLQFIKDVETVIVESPDAIRWHNYDTFWALDMSAPDMLGVPVHLPEQLKHIVIDHHQTNDGWGTVNLVEPEQIATAAVLYHFFKEAGIEYDKDTAMALLTGLVTDAGFFAHIKDGKPLRIAADLIDMYGLNYQEITFNIQKQQEIEDMLFVGTALSHLRADYEKKVAIISIPYTVYSTLGPAAEHSYLLTGYISSLNGTEFGMVVIEDKPGHFKINLRSRNREFDVGAIAKKLGGGGHKNAAGAKIEAENIENAITTILSQIDN